MLSLPEFKCCTAPCVCLLQAEKDNDEPYSCLSDFVAPKGSGVDDYVGMFACTAGLGLEDIIHKFKEVS